MLTPKRERSASTLVVCFNYLKTKQLKEMIEFAKIQFPRIKQKTLFYYLLIFNLLYHKVYYFG